MFRLATLIVSSLLGLSARAEAPRRVVLVDTVTFTPALERANAHQKMLDAVAGTLILHGWKAVPSAECHDLTCIGPAAAAAQTSYALILTGSYAGGEDLSASDVGVSLWRDGAVVARRTEADEQAEAEHTSTGVFFPCGPPNGTCVTTVFTSKMQAYSAKLLDAESAAIRQREEARPKPVAPQAPVVVGPATPVAPPASRSGSIAGWSLVGLGAGALGGGVALWAYDHSGTDCHSLGSSGCRQSRSTGTAAAVVGGIGAAAVVAGVVVLVVDRDGSRVGLSVSPAGLALGGRF